MPEQQHNIKITISIRDMDKSILCTIFFGHTVDCWANRGQLEGENIGMDMVTSFLKGTKFPNICSEFKGRLQYRQV